ncbi:ABC transporter ATP-binding protein [bacterium AH-315-J04]|nr:ABC transporter ATP-binding protein [bacterium AH-315-J04]
MAGTKLPVVQTAGLCKTFKDFWRRPRIDAVKDLSMEIHAGEVFGLLGPNGSGKTTTIKMLLGLLYPTHGRISLFGKPPTDVSVKARIGFLPEESYLYRFLTARETLDFFGRLFRLPKQIREDRTTHLLDMVGLSHEADRPVGEFSKGMARRIGLAQALINDPEFLILDEPTSGLDPIGARQIKDVIRSLGQKGKTIMLSSHVLSDVEDVCDNVTILYGGQEQAEGRIDDLLCQNNVTQITMPTISDETIREVKDLILRLEKKNVDVSHPRHKLEDFFLQIVTQAQAADVKTSGARAGGHVPDFLKTATVTEMVDLVGSLVAASVEPEPSVAPAMSQLSKKQEAPASGVLNELLGKEPVEVDTPDDSPVSHETDAPDSPIKPSVSADSQVIDSLLQGENKESDDTASSEPNA